MTVQLRLPILRSDQAKIAVHPAKIKAVNAGRRYGKTTMGGCMASSTAHYGGKIAWVVPTYKNGRPLWRWLTTVTMPLVTNSPKLVKMNRSDRTAEFLYSGGFIALFSADNIDAIRGDWFNLVIIDEAARISEEAYTDAIMPTVADVNGDIVLLTTPVGRNWYWKLALQGQRGNGKNGIMYFHAPSHLNPNPHIRRAAEMARGRVTDRTYRQEWLAEFIAGAGTVFIGLDKVFILPKKWIAPSEVEDHYTVMGIDWGKKQDFTVVSIFDADTKKELDLIRFRQEDYNLQRKRITELCRQWNVDRILAESNAMGEAVIDELKYGAEYKHSNVLITINTHGDESYTHYETGGFDGPFRPVYNPAGKYDLMYNPEDCRYGKMIPTETPSKVPSHLWGAGMYREGLPISGFATTAQSKPKLIDNYTLAIEQEMGLWLDDPEAMLEHEAFEYKQMANNHIQYSAPDDSHDDTIIGRALSWRQSNSSGYALLKMYQSANSTSMGGDPEKVLNQMYGRNSITVRPVNGSNGSVDSIIKDIMKVY